jgi:tripartite ATP-independent transporter DctM subunit
MELGIFLAVFVFAMFLGMPIAFAMIIGTVSYALLAQIDLGFITLQMFAGLDSFLLLAIPLFILTSEVMDRSGVAARIYDFVHVLVGRLPGGMAHVDVVNSVIFSGMSGSALADVGGIGRMGYLAMVNKGYAAPFSAAVVVSSSVIGPLIPPSIPMVVLAMVSGISIQRLFFGGALPGLLVAVAMFVYIHMRFRRTHVPGHESVWSFPMLVTAFAKAFLPLLTPVVLLGGIWFGVVTITEAAGLAVSYALLLGLVVYRTLGTTELWACLKSVFHSCGPILILLPAAKVFGFVLTLEQVPDLFTQTVLAITDNPWLILIAVNLLFLVAGLFSDPTVNIMLFVPIVMPLAQSIGMDPVQFGVMVVFNCMIGLVTPPVGAALFAIIGLDRMRLSLESLVRAMLPFYVMLLGLLVLIALVPALSTALPNALYGK